MYDVHIRRRKSCTRDLKKKTKGEIKIDTGEINNVKKITFFGHMVNLYKRDKAS